VFDVDFAAGLQVSTSDDEGETWTSSTVPQSWNSDHQNLFAGPPPQGAPEPVGYPEVVYLCSIGGGALAGYGTATTCTRSFDGGLTFSPSGEPAFLDGQNEDSGHFGISGHCGGETGHGFADRKGLVYLARGWCGQPWLAISKDAGQSWTRVQVAKTGMPESPGGLQEHEAGVVADPAGNVYVVWTGRDRLPYLAISRNGGKSFGRAMMIGPPGLRESSLPTIDVGDNGRLAIAYIGSTNAPGGKSPTGEGPKYKDATWNGYVTVTASALDRRPIFYTANINKEGDPLVRGGCPILRCQQQFDFIDVVIGPDGTPWTSMVDGCLKGKCEDLGLAITGHLVAGPRLVSKNAFSK
ncbi:MAG: sialidase family protein, partial [Actinomycetota bacterium]